MRIYLENLPIRWEESVNPSPARQLAKCAERVICEWGKCFAITSFLSFSWWVASSIATEQYPLYIPCYITCSLIGLGASIGYSAAMRKAK
jgi:apolipoprotein N-acyltransferase